MWLETGPPFITVHTMSSPDTSFTSSPIRPSSNRMEDPGLTSFGSCLYVMETSFSVPRISLAVRVNSCPSFNSTLPASKSPRRISGPFVSSSAATGRPSSLEYFLKLFNLPPCSSKSPWEKFILATFIPASINFFKVSPFSVDGPIVQIIFVLRIQLFLL